MEVLAFHCTSDNHSWICQIS